MRHPLRGWVPTAPAPCTQPALYPPRASGSPGPREAGGAGSGPRVLRLRAEDAGRAGPGRASHWLRPAGAPSANQSCRGRGLRGSPGGRGAALLSGFANLGAPVSPWSFYQTPARPDPTRPTRRRPAMGPPCRSLFALLLLLQVRRVPPAFPGAPSGPILRAPGPPVPSSLAVSSSLLSSPLPLLPRKFGSKGPGAA